MFDCVKSGEYVLTVMRSEFIASSYLIGSRDEAKRISSELRAKHRDARHVCYGYIADEIGDDFGYDDDGEPSGTAGKPIYSALAAADVRRSLIAVVRYFGGIKLGAGGLTRAYREAATGLIERVGTVKAERRAEYSVTCGQSEYKRIAATLRALPAECGNIVYNDKVSFCLTAPIEFDVCAAITPLGAKVEYLSEKFCFIQ